MAIQNRRGSYSAFDGGQNLEDGEIGVVMSGDTTTDDGTGTYISNGGGIVHRLLTDDDKTELASDIADNATDISALNATLTNINAVSDTTDSPSDVSVPSNISAWTELTSLTVSEGTYLVIGYAVFDNNATGLRGVALSTLASPSGIFSRTITLVNAVSGGHTMLSSIRVMSFTSSQTIRVFGRQNSGSALNSYGRITAVRLR